MLDLLKNTLAEEKANYIKRNKEVTDCPIAEYYRKSECERNLEQCEVNYLKGRLDGVRELIEKIKMVGEGTYPQDEIC